MMSLLSIRYTPLDISKRDSKLEMPRITGSGHRSARRPERIERSTSSLSSKKPPLPQPGLMKIIAAWQFGQVKRVICEPNSLSQRDYKPLAGGKRSATTGNA